MTSSKEIEFRQHALAINTLEDEGGTSVRDTTDHQYGRRIEADRTWTVYHVFTGVPARENSSLMTGLSRLDATEGMLTLNRRSVERRKKRIAPPIFATSDSGPACPR